MADADALTARGMTTKAGVKMCENSATYLIIAYNYNKNLKF